jgi:hypothetical protein
MEMDFDFIDLGVPVNKQAAPLSSNGNKEKRDLKKKCTFLFNLVLTPLVLYLSFSTWLFKPAVDNRANISNFGWASLPWHYMFGYTELVVGLLIILTMFFLIPFTIQIIWNRLISNIFNIREITYAEAYTMYLLIGLIQS